MEVNVLLSVERQAALSTWRCHTFQGSDLEQCFQIPRTNWIRLGPELLRGRRHFLSLTPPPPLSPNVVVASSLELTAGPHAHPPQVPVFFPPFVPFSYFHSLLLPLLCLHTRVSPPRFLHAHPALERGRLELSWPHHQELRGLSPSHYSEWESFHHP